MALTPVTVEGFGGLNVITDPQELGWAGATDLLNTSFDRAGRFRARDGYTKFSTSAAAEPIQYLVPMPTFSPPRLAVITATHFYTLDLSTGVLTNRNTLGATAATITRPALYGDITADVNVALTAGATTGYASYFADGTTGGIFVTGGSPQYLCAVSSRGIGGLAPRLAQAGYFTGTDAPVDNAGTPDAVFFSEPGQWNWVSGNWVRLDPGDGERFTGMVAWNGSLYLFKNSKVFEFYAEGTLSDGTPEFLYRRINLPDPIPMVTSPTSWQPTAVGTDGIYYAASTGLWVLGAGGPRRVGAAIDPILAGTADSTLAVGNVGEVRMEWAGPQLFIAYSLASSAQRLLVWDTRTDLWTLHAYAHTLTALPTLAPTLGGALFFGASDGNVYKSTAATTDDNGTSISWRYQSGYRAPANGQRIKQRGSSIWGTGTATLQMLTQGARSADVADTGGSVTLGTSPTVAEGKRIRSCRGVAFAHKLSGTGPATVSRLTHRFLQPEQDV